MPRPRALVSLSLGAVLGAFVLGPGGRLAMRGVTLWEHRPHLFSIRGTATIVAWGAAFGLAAGVLRIALDAMFDRWAPTASCRARLVAYVVLCLGVALVLLTPWTLPRLVLFPPIVIVFLVVFEVLRRRWASHGLTPQL